MNEEKTKQEILEEFDNNKFLYASFVKMMESLIMNLIEAKSIKISSLSSRVKERNSLSNKIDRKQKVISEDSEPTMLKYDELSDLTDICGIRICTFYSDDVDKIASIIKQEFTVDTKNSIDKRIAMEPDKFGYLSLHYIVSLTESRSNLTEYTHFKNIKFEIQIRTILQHTWAEIEHDLGYKSTKGLPRDIQRDFSRLAGLLELADKEFLSIRTYLDDYKHDINKRIQKTSIDSDILIDRITLNEFIKSNFFIEQVNFIAESINKPVKNSIEKDTIDGLTVAFEHLNISTISDLKKLLDKSKHLMIKRLSSDDANQVVDQGVLYYSLYYKILEESLPAEELKVIFNILNIRSNYNKVYSSLDSLYKSIIDTQ